MLSLSTIFASSALASRSQRVLHRRLPLSTSFASSVLALNVQRVILLSSAGNSRELQGLGLISGLDLVVLCVIRPILDHRALQHRELGLDVRGEAKRRVCARRE